LRQDTFANYSSKKLLARNIDPLAVGETRNLCPILEYLVETKNLINNLEDYVKRHQRVMFWDQQ
jgi:hypothetical protein